ncbi:protein-glutamine gamma-glutamyltransferase 2-like [Lampetra planeri]
MEGTGHHRTSPSESTVLDFLETHPELLESHILGHCTADQVNRWLCKLQGGGGGGLASSPSKSRSSLLARRGRPFIIDVHLGDSYRFEPDRDELSLSLRLGPNPQESDRTLILLSSNGAANGDGGGWSLDVEPLAAEEEEEAAIEVPEPGTTAWEERQSLSLDLSAVAIGGGEAGGHPAGGRLRLSVRSPADAIVGEYLLSLELIVGVEPLQITGFTVGKVWMVFNPWCPGDAVYMEDEIGVNEYVLNEKGLVYMGSNDYIYSIPWDFSQFADRVVEICFQIMDNSNSALDDLEKDVPRRADPIHVSRVVSAMINSNDDRGVLNGRWNEHYTDGTNPMHWTGSANILRQWSDSGFEPVRYGQCWVFAAAACTVLRALGIPSRCVTNYLSAHDTDGNLACDRFFREEDLQQVLKGRNDSVWNFHCWVESWMARPDLPPGNDGWQVIDPTPQERSNGVFCVGPAPVVAVRDGEVRHPYEAAFVFAEVNADVVNWVVTAGGEKRRANCFTGFVGQNISTKHVGSDEREDITHLYKHPEGSAEEREAFERAGRGARDAAVVLRDLEALIKLSASAFVGSNVDAHTVVRNRSGRDLTLTLTSAAAALTYTGQCGAECGARSCSVTVPAGQTARETLRVKYKDYGEHLTDQNLLRVTSLLEEPSSGQLVIMERNITLKRPRITVAIVGEPRQNRKIKARISFTNPLPSKLIHSVFSIDGEGLTSLQKIPEPAAEIGPGETLTVAAELAPSRPGTFLLSVVFNSDRIRDAHESKRVIVRP